MTRIPSAPTVQPAASSSAPAARRLLRSATVSAEERAAIDGQLAVLGLGDEAAALIAAELDAPVDVGRIAALAQNEAEATQIYAATLMIVDETNPAEKGYLAMLAARMNLDQGLVDHLHAEAERL